MSGSPADLLLTLVDIEIVHSRAHELSMTHGWPMTDWTDQWSRGWGERLEACRMYLEYGPLCAPAEVAALLWVYGAMLQVPRHDGHKRVATGAMEAQVVRFGYRLVTRGRELSSKAYEIVDVCENRGDRDAAIADTAAWIDDRME